MKKLAQMRDTRPMELHGGELPGPDTSSPTRPPAFACGSRLNWLFFLCGLGGLCVRKKDFHAKTAKTAKEELSA